MSRRNAAAVRDVLPDPVYNSKVVTKLVNQVMVDGKKSVAQTVCYDAFNIMAEKLGTDAMTIFNQAMENVKPVLEVKARRVGVMGNAGQVNYAASKAGVIGMTKSLARELASRKITVNAVAPGMIETDMTGCLSEAAKAKILDSIPFKEMGCAADVAGLVAFLAGEDSRYITGQVICVDGGMAI